MQRALRYPLLIISMSLICSIMAIYVSLEYRQQHEQHGQQQQQQLQQLRSQLESAQQQQQNQQQYAELYQTLQQYQMFDEEPRLHWFSQLKQFKQLSFQIEPQQVQQHANWQILASPVVLKLNLLHEQQLLDFFNTLQHNIPNWLQLENCSLQRLSTPSDNINLSAECHGNWITLKRNNP